MNANSSTMSQWLKQATTLLEKAEIGTARLDALVLLEDFTCKDRSWLLANPDSELKDTEKLNVQIKQRAEHVPLAYIRGFTEFYGRRFIVNERVLEPRPESETMINLLKGLSLPNVPVIADIGTGSGALGLTAALEIPGSKVTLVDIDEECLKVAALNKKELGLGVVICQANLAEDADKADVLLCNLPYVPDDYHINTAASHEPRLAIFGGLDGLDLYRELFTQLETRDVQYVLTESLPFQHDALAEIARSHGYKLNQTDDFIQLFERN